MQDKVSIHCFVSGLVQGVWFRAGTQDQAKKLGLTGWVRNLPDGRVEVLACGEKAQISQLKEWLKEGPPRARVNDVSYDDVDWKEYAEFEIL